MKRSTGCALAITMLMVTACGGGTDEGADATTATTIEEPAPTTAGAAAETSAAPETVAPTTMAPTTEEGTDDPYDYGPSESDTTKASATTAPTAGGGGGDTVVVSETDLGSFLTTADGWSLYLFTMDEQGESTCYDDCEANWPPLTGEFTAGDGV
ncbi:MAG: hypothetical protein GEU79_18580, partial [Acidimicrobiia bacterium]|nr:hypothetical protein [Acidimicrobiia bacterium]